MTEYNLLNKPGRKKLFVFLCLVFLIGYAFFFLNSAKMDEFTSLITDTTVQYQDNGVLKDYDHTPLKDNTHLIFNIKATLPQGVLSYNEDVEKDGETTQEIVVKNNALTFSLPEQLKLDNTETNKLYLEDDLNTSIGNYEIKDNLLTMYLNDDYVKKDADQELKLVLVVETDSNHLIYDGEGLSKVYFNDKEVDVYKYIEQPTETTVTQQVDSSVVGEATQYSEEPQETNNQEGSITAYSDATQSTDIQKTDKSVDFKDYLTGASIRKNVNGHWVAVDDNVFTDGDQVQVGLSYKLPANTVTTDNKVIYYQLPDGIRPIEEQSGNVTQGGKVVGTYHIGTDGEILIQFNDDFADGEAFTGDIQFEGIIAKNGDGDQEKINFGGDTEDITVKKKADNYDINLTKKATLNSDAKKVDYKIVASTTHGTGDTVTITDNFSANTNATGTYVHDSMKIYKVSADGTKTEVTDVKPTFSQTNDGQNQFTYENLPKLEKGESYEIEYSATYDEKTTGTDGSSKLQNNAHAGNKYVNRWTNSTVEISKTMISKSGWYDQTTGLIRWQIKLNEGKQDIGGYNLKDALPEGIEFSGDIEMVDSNGNKTTIKPNGNSIDYTFPSGSNDTYTITYYTTAPNENGEVSNTSTIEKDGKSNTSTGTIGVQHRTWGVEKQWKKEDVSQNDGLRRYYWNSTVTIPDGNLTEFTYKDTIEDATDADGKTQEGSHYAIASELDQALKQNINIRINGTTYNYTNDFVDFEFIYYDETGNTVQATDSTTHVKSFEVKVKSKDGQTITKAQYLYINEYPTIADASKVDYGESWKYKNIAEVNDLKNETSHTYTRPKPVIKQGGKENEYGAQYGISYKNGVISGDLEQVNGKLYYRVLVNTQSGKSDEITLTDTLPNGAKYIEGSLKAAFYVNDSYSYIEATTYDQKYKGEYGWVDNGDNGYYSYNLKTTHKPTVSQDGDQLKIIIPKGYNYNLADNATGHIIQLTYELDISEDSSWNDPTQSSKTYTNTISWGDHSDTQETEITRDLDEVQKKGAQVYDENGQPTNKVKYNVTINPASKDLDPKSDTLTLKDTITLPNGATATLDIDNTKLYYLDLSNKENYYHGAEVNTDLYRISYDDLTNEISAIVPDQFACVLEYTYSIDAGNIAGDYNVSNKASLNGEFSSEANNNLKNVSSSATVEKGKLKIYKVDDKDFSKKLTGAEFKLEKFDATSNQWIDITSEIAYDGKSIKTNENGEIIIQGSSEDKKLVGETIYRLTETKAPADYDLSEEGYCFVLVKAQDNQTIVSTKAKMSSTFASAGVDINKTHFFNNNEEVNMYVTNHTSNIGVKKVWLDKDNKPLANYPSSTTVKLIRHVNKPKGHKVNVKIYDNQTSKYEYDDILYVPDNGKLKIVLPFSCNTGELDNFKNNNLTISGTNNYKIYNQSDYYSPIVIEIENISSPISIDAKWWFQYESSDPIYDYEKEYESESREIDKQTLNADNNWTYTWNKSDFNYTPNDGEEYYYTVEEEVPSGYQVSYTNNDGIKEGDITVTNKKLDNYDLPDAGGLGTLGYYAFGALLITATLFAYIANKRSKEGI